MKKNFNCINAGIVNIQKVFFFYNAVDKLQYISKL